MTAPIATGLITLTPLSTNTPFGGNTLVLPISMILGFYQNGPDTTTSVVLLNTTEKGLNFSNALIVNQTVASLTSAYNAVSAGPTATSLMTFTQTAAGALSPNPFGGNVFSAPVASIAGFTQNGTDPTTSVVYFNRDIRGANFSNVITVNASVASLTSTYNALP